MIGSIISAGSSLLGGLFGASEASKNRKLQKKFAKNSIQWRVEDAKKAGIHPLAALGAAGTSYTPVNSGFGDAVAQAGANIGEEVRRSGSRSQKTAIDAINRRMIESNIEVNQAQRDLYRAQALNVTAEARNKAVGAVGGKNTLPVFDGTPTPYQANTSSADELENQHGELGDLLAGIATINGINPFKKNPFFYIKKKPRGKPRKYGPTNVGGPQP